MPGAPRAGAGPQGRSVNSSALEYSTCGAGGVAGGSGLAGARVHGFGFRVVGRLQGFGIRFKGESVRGRVGFKGSGFRVQGSGFRVQVPNLYPHT